MQSLFAVLVVALTAAQLFPKMLDTYNGKNLNEISTSKYGLMGLTAFLWTIYGSNQADTAVVFAGLIIFSTVCVILFLKFRSGKNSNPSRKNSTIRRRR
jgi:uncharacterized protein with PQ loop repeat